MECWRRRDIDVVDKLLSLVGEDVLCRGFLPLPLCRLDLINISFSKSLCCPA